MLNHIDLAGRLVGDPEYKETESYKMTRFTIAVDRDFSKGEEKESDFIRCVAFRSTATFIANYFAKGDLIIVSGRLQVSEDKEKKRSFVNVAVENAYFGGKKEKKEKKETQATGFKFSDINPEDEELIPF